MAAERVFKWRDDVDAGRGRSPSLTDKAYEGIRERIVERSLEPGHDFTEAELARDLQMSKTPVREALARLQMEGFVQAIPRRGYMVTPLHMSAIRDLFAFRALVDGEAAALAARNLASAHADELKELLEVSALSAPAIKPDASAIARMIRIDNAFHEIIALASGNARLHRCIVGVLREFERFYHIEASHPEFYGSDFVGHSDVYDAILKSDPEYARKTMHAHLESSRRVLIKGLTEGPSETGGQSAWI
ncbi:GntR family transcriptional regulator [Martelella radicis]|uniref:DNA-binding GntR family transcriptional regulator n=1 Tax=Martelella radicis TaxID=1397476 RepID=A0A7W6KFR6_9HYPH|nr:GntR family transcriptional regulator [Martelella radicis]MBB4120419.1 DNA-binding GntR family transcriptional regulator [Martelella radicis]